MKKKSEKKHDTANVEFGLEFGDMNAAKIFDTLSESHRKSSKKK